MRDGKQIAVMSLVVEFFAGRKAGGFFDWDCDAGPGFGVSDGVALNSFDGDIMWGGDDIFWVVDFVAINMIWVLVWVVVVYSLIYLYSFAEVEHGKVNFRFIM